MGMLRLRVQPAWLPTELFQIQYRFKAVYYTSLRHCHELLIAFLKMGIDGLLPALRSVSRAAHISEYRGQRVAVDSYVWLHRGVFTCARELALGQATDKYGAEPRAPAP